MSTLFPNSPAAPGHSDIAVLKRNGQISQRQEQDISQRQRMGTGVLRELSGHSAHV